MIDRYVLELTPTVQYPGPTSGFIGAETHLASTEAAEMWLGQHNWEWMGYLTINK